MNKKFYVTTPIYYWNWIPHIWHFYTSNIANIINNFQKINWKDTKFTTWIDENSQKAVIKAEEAWKKVMDYLDEMAEIHKWVWDFFELDYDDFIRTTSTRHKKIVQEVLQKCFEKGDIYEWVYKWKYCVWCEAFKKDDDLIEVDWKKVCPDHLKEPDLINEKNYFFKLSKYQTWLEEFYDSNKNFINPDFRYNEVKSFVKKWLEDFSISRETNTFWIPLPFDNSQVTYVWFDALFNYYTSCVYSPIDKNKAFLENISEDLENWTYENKKDFWIWNEENREILHIVWKDIIRFHAIYWPAMLASYFSLWEEKDWIIHFLEKDREFLPTQILVNWFFTVDWQKMSKSLWNVIEPIEYSKNYSKDLLILYMFSAFSIWRDWDYDRKDAIFQYNAKLANNLWNLLNRAVVLTLKLDLENWFENEKINENIWENLEKYKKDFEKYFEKYDFKNLLDSTFRFLDELNLFVTEKEPWKLMKDEKTLSEAKNILFTICESLRQVSLNLYAFFPKKMNQVFISLWLKDYENELLNWKYKDLKNKKENFKITEKPEILFEKFEI